MKILSFDIVLVGLRHLNLDSIQMNLKVFAWLAELKGHWSAEWAARITEEKVLSTTITLQTAFTNKGAEEKARNMRNLCLPEFRRLKFWH